MHSGIFHETSDRNVHCTEKQLNICSLNIQGLMKYSDNTQFQDYCKLVDIIALYETWQRCGNDFKNFLQGYTNFDAIRKRTRNTARGSGGVTVFVKDWMMQTSGGQTYFP